MATEVIMPKVDMVMDEGTLVEWLREEGEHVNKGEPLFIILTDKANIEIEAPADGVLAGVRAQPGDVVPVTEVLAYVLGPGPDGPVATVRFEMIREGVQEAEARICIEKALANPALRQKLGEDRAAALQGLLDQRTRDILRAKAGSDCAWLWYASLIQERSDQLYAAAAEVAARSRPSD